MNQTLERKETSFQTVENEKAEVEIDLLALCFHLLEHWKMILICFLAGMLVMAGCTVFLMEPRYEAISKMYVLGSGDSAVTLSGLQLGAYLANDYQEIFATHEVTGAVADNLGLPYTYDQMQDMLSIVNPAGTRILHIKVTSADPVQAAAISNEYLDVASQYAADVMAAERPTTLSAALVPDHPVSPSLAQNMVLGAITGVVLACAYLVVCFMLDDKVRSAEDITNLTGLPVLAEIPVFAVRSSQPLSAKAAEPALQNTVQQEE